MNPAGVVTSIIEQALPSPIEPMSPYASWASPGYEDPLEQFVDNLSTGVGTVRTSTPINNASPAGAGTPLRASTPIQQGNAVGVGATTFGTRAIPGPAATPPGQTYLTAAQWGKGPAAGQRAIMAQKAPRRRPRAPTPSSPSDAGSQRRSSASNRNGGGRRSGGGGGGGGGGGDGDDDDDNDDGDTTLSSIAGPSRHRRRRRADRVLNDAEMQQQLAQILQDQRQTAAGRHIRVSPPPTRSRRHTKTDDALR